ncbi:aminopeptidase P N-terminal domain-containing protein [Piscinibacter sakaiensis]|uniref:Xaa-Pro aminopeptidase n=1 Tax=Piscinibacter sakaiensis TaxID=1547922 RepID=A0A0K8NX21_PISS1|nr:aminopeptidase P N-terminal domain-containing protein [Piscinibacter sakaiensis]GAP34480.1 Xaa-Pro aminopeptidase [Piscinibacter sakaiensis]
MPETPEPLPCLSRRAALAARLRAAGGGVAVLPTAPARLRNGDSEYPYRGSSHFQHLTGFDEPEAWLVLDASGHSTLFLREKDPEREVWDGRRLGVDAAPQVLGVDRARPVSALDEDLPALLDGQPAVWWPFGETPGLEARVEGWLALLRGRARRGARVPEALRDLGPLVGEMRLVKDAGEIATMRRAAAISADAHRRAMRWCGARFRAGATAIPEYEIEAELLHEFRRQGAAGPAYTSIVAAGENACVLHHVAGATPLRPGQLCLIDAGCEFDGYASDITRTFPADGRFSAPQRALYALVQAAQQAAADATRPGARLRDAHHAAVRVLSQGLLDLGLLRREVVGDLDAVIDSAAYRRFYMHGTGHWLGRDVHDSGDDLAPDEAPVEQADGLGGRVMRRPSRVLVPGMVVTLEPGLYVRPADDVDPCWWNLGLRIEDDAVVTPQGCELISRGVPVDPDAIEALMRAD